MEFADARGKLGLSQGEMGRLLGMAGSEYSRIERGAREPTKQHRATLDLVLFIDLVSDLHRCPGIKEFLKLRA